MCAHPLRVVRKVPKQVFQNNTMQRECIARLYNVTKQLTVLSRRGKRWLVGDHLFCSVETDDVNRRIVTIQILKPSLCSTKHNRETFERFELPKSYMFTGMSN